MIDLPLLVAALALALAAAALVLLYRRRGETAAEGHSAGGHAEDAQATAERASPAGFERLLAHLPGMAYRAGEDGTVELVSDGCLELTGHPPEAFLSGQIGLADLVHPEDRATVAEETHLAMAQRRPFELTYRIYTAQGQERWVWDKGRPVADDGSPVTRIEGFVSDVTALRQSQERLLYDAFHDGLTGLANRSLLLERVDMALRRQRRRSRFSFAVLFLDLDRFKVINDSLGHEPGNQVLRITARRLEACLRQEDTVARLGGDEFAVLLDEISDAGDAVRVASRILEVLALPIYLGREEVFTNASLGIASSLSGYKHPEEPLRDAEIAMYRAKAQGGGQHELFDRTMHRRAVAQLRLESDLRRAIKRQELRLVYQPIVDLAGGRVCGFEALMRWRHPERGLLRPQEFLGIAVDTGLIVPMSWWVLEQAGRQMVRWQQRFPAESPFYVSVNLTSKQFSQNDLAERIQGVLFETGLAPGSLHIEITENVVMHHADSVDATLARIRDQGVHLALDDFGTGYSSLASLRHLPLQSLKIDRSFVSALSGKHTSMEIVRTIVDLAHNLDMEVVAEGVEEADQMSSLLELGCDFGQGYLFARPMEPAAVEEMLEAQSEGEIRLLA